MRRDGYTILEVMIATGIFGMVMAGAVSVFFVSNRSWYSADVQARCAREADMVLQKMTYGACGENGLRSAVFTNVQIAATGSEWDVTYDTPDGGKFRFSYDPVDRTIQYADLVMSNGTVNIGENIQASTVAQVTNGLTIMVQVVLSEGRFGATNTMSTYVRYRN